MDEDRLKSRIDEAMKCEFVGDYIFSETELRQIFMRANLICRKWWQYKDCELCPEDNRIVFLSVVHSVREWNTDEGPFWEYVCKKIVGFYDSGMYTFLQDVVKNAINNDGILYAKKGQWYYTTCRMHSFAPINSTEALFALCWSIYCRDMGLEYYDDDEFYENLAGVLRKKFERIDDLEQGLTLSSGIYGIKTEIRRLAIDWPKEMAALLRRTIELIDCAFRDVPYSQDRYYNQIFHHWWQGKKLTFGQSIEKDRRRKEPISRRFELDPKKLHPKYVMREGSAVYLVVPSFFVENSGDGNCYVSVYCGGSKIDSRIFEINEGSGLFNIVEGGEICLNSCRLKDLSLRIEIRCGAEIIYDSKKTLAREWILFKDGKEVFETQCACGNYNLYIAPYIAPSLDMVLTSYPENIKIQNPGCYVFNAQENEMLQSAGRTVFFASGEKQRSAWFTYKGINIAYFRDEASDFEIIDGGLGLEIGKGQNVGDLGIRCAKISQRLCEFPFEYREEGGKCYDITGLLSPGVPRTILLFRYSDNKIVASVSVVKFDDVDIKFDRRFYYDRFSQGHVYFRTRRYNLETKFSIFDGDPSIDMEEGQLIFSPPIAKWRIDEGEWNIKSQGNVAWYKEALTNTSVIELDLPKDIIYCLRLYDKKDRFLQDLRNADDSYHKYPLGQTVYALKSKSDELSLFMEIGNERFQVLTIRTEEAFVGSPLIQTGRDTLIWNTDSSFIGDRDSKFAVEIRSKKDRMFFELGTEAVTLDVSTLPDGFYEVSVCLKRRVLFSKPDEKELWSEQICLGDADRLRFQGKIMEISEVFLTGKSHPNKIGTFYLGNVQFMQWRDGYAFYSADDLYLVAEDGARKKVFAMKNENGEPERVIPVRIELMNDNCCWIVAGLNKNDISDFLGEFTLYRNKISNRNREAEGIDFYQFRLLEE